MSPFDAEGKRYSDATAQAKALASIGKVVQGIGVIAIVVAGGGGLVLWENSGVMAIALGVGGVALGVVLLALGSLIAAMGQVLGAIVNTAINTRVSANVALEEGEAASVHNAAS